MVNFNDPMYGFAPRMSIPSYSTAPPPAAFAPSVAPMPQQQPRGLLGMLGLGNTGLGGFVDSRRARLAAFGAGLASGRTLGEGLALGAQGAAGARQIDVENATNQQKLSKTREWFQKMSASDPFYAELMHAVDSGMPMQDAWAAAMKHQSGGGGEAPKVVELYDEKTGAPYKAQYNPQTGQYERVGGNKGESFSGSTSVTVNNGEGSKFYNTLDASQADMFGSLLSGGMEAQQTIIKIDRLESLLANVDTGVSGSVKQVAGNFGINTEGLDDIQAAQALINQLVPSQRPVGSGPMSDADLELFKQSMPRIINQPGGNELILETLRGIAEYTIAQSKIAAMVADRTMTPSEGRKALYQLPNPLDGLTGGGGDIDDLLRKYDY